MLQLFRRFDWSLALVLAVLAVALRAVGLLLAPAGIEGGLDALGPLGHWLPAARAGDQLGGWLLGALSVVALGALGAHTLNYYRLGAAGMVPALVAVLLGSAAAWWLGFTPYFAAALLLALATQRLFGGYRHQGAALPVFDCGLLLGGAWLIAPPFAWFGLWAALALGQLRKLKGADLLKLVIGLAALPFIAGTWAYVWGDVVAFRQNLFSGVVGEDIVAGFGESWWTLAVLALVSGACVGAFGRLTARRPIQEQRAMRMYYTMLAVSWVAVLASGATGREALALQLYPVSILLGLWLSEFDRRSADVVLLVAIAVSAAGYAYFLLAPT